MKGTGKLEDLNPSVKAGTVLISVILLSFQYLIPLNLAVFVCSILLLAFFSRARLKMAAAILIPAFVAASGMFMMGLYYARGSSIQASELASFSTAPYAVRAAMSTNLTTALQLASRLLAFASLGVLFVLTTDSEYFVSSLMHQCGLPPKFAYGILAALHLLPNLKREFKQVKLAFAARGIRGTACSLKPVFTMLVNGIRWSESVAMAMESKGFCGGAERTFYSIPRVHWYDWVCCGGFVAAIVAGMVFLHEMGGV